jgi:argininosuccinate lyase
MESLRNIKMYYCLATPIYKLQCHRLSDVVFAYETLIDDITMLNAALKVDQNPLGSAAGYGSSFPIDRTLQHKNWVLKLKIQFGSRSNESWKIRKTVAFAMSSVAATLQNSQCLFVYESKF